MNDAVIPDDLGSGYGKYSHPTSIIQDGLPFLKPYLAQDSGWIYERAAYSQHRRHDHKPNSGHHQPFRPPFEYQAPEHQDA